MSLYPVKKKAGNSRVTLVTHGKNPRDPRMGSQLIAPPASTDATGPEAVQARPKTRPVHIWKAIRISVCISYTLTPSFCPYP